MEKLTHTFHLPVGLELLGYRLTVLLMGWKFKT